MRELKLGLLDALGVVKGCAFFVDGARKGALEDVFFGLGNGLENLGAYAEVLREDGLRGVGCRRRLAYVPEWMMRRGRLRERELTKPISKDECRIFREVAVVEDQQKLSAVGCQALERMWVTRWKVP